MLLIIIHQCSHLVLAFSLLGDFLLLVQSPLTIGLYRLSTSSRFHLARLCVSRNLSISSGLPTWISQLPPGRFGLCTVLSVCFCEGTWSGNLLLCHLPMSPGLVSPVACEGGLVSGLFPWLVDVHPLIVFFVSKYPLFMRTTVKWIRSDLNGIILIWLAL